ncbi:chemotaxis protein CheW [Sphingosinicella terrae]|uniref:chemotaxis protein CheW n=1 Tax=Sphingosinicella terrae TaxID=2172047 RepID=UPI0013B3C2C7|nr:CheW domain-containing protein [Sphingosinicella terrae]
MIPNGPFLLCEIGDDRVAIEAADVREILPVLPLWRPPTLPRPLAGFIRVRGEVLPVLAPAILFGTADAGPLDVFAHIVRTHGEPHASLCLLVDRVEDLVSPDPAAVRPIDAGASQNGAFVAELDLDGGMAHLLALDRLLDESERARIAALTEDAARREELWSATDAA